MKKKFTLLLSALCLFCSLIKAQSWSELGGLNGLYTPTIINSVCSDASGNIYAAGYFTNSSGKHYVAKYSFSSGITSPLSENSFVLFPNPASGNSFINYTFSTSAIVSIALYDVLGNKLQQVVNGNEQQGEHNATIDARKLANGVYVLQIRAGEQLAEQKIIVMN